MHPPAAETTSAAPSQRPSTQSRLDAAYASAVAAAGGEVVRRIRIAELRIDLRSAGPAMLERLGGAFAHLVDDTDGPPGLDVCLWDSSDDPAATPPLPATDPNEPRGAVFYSSDGPFELAYQPGLGQLSALDADRAVAWFWSRDHNELPFWEPSAPIRQILHWWFARNDLMLVHGAAVGNADGGVLLVGRGGSGKSTCALATLMSDLLYAGDDYVAVRVGATPWIYSVYSSGKLEPEHSRLLPHLPAPGFAGDPSLDEKSVFYVSERFADRMCRGFPLRAVLVPRVTGSAPRIVPVDKATALRALAPSTLLQLYPARPDALARMAALLRVVPAFGFEVGGDIDGIPRAIEAFLAGEPA